MKHKAVIGRCKIAKHRIELEPEAITHREDARRMCPDKAVKANQKVQNLLASGKLINSNRFLPTGRDTRSGPANLHARKTNNGARGTLRSARLVLHQHGRHALASHGMARSQSDF